jgi:hypothetical protein
VVGECKVHSGLDLVPQASLCTRYHGLVLHGSLLGTDRGQYDEVMKSHPAGKNQFKCHRFQTARAQARAAWVLTDELVWRA